MSRIAEIPSIQEVEQARESSRTLSKYADQERITLTIRGSDGSKDDIVLPGHVMEMLLQILTHMARGNAIRIMPLSSALTTQEVANLMNVSRPHVVKLLDSGEIPFHKVGAHRRVKLQALLDYLKSNQEVREQALDELAELSQSSGMY